MRDADWGAELDRVGRGEQPGDRRASPVELQLHAAARNLLLVSAMLLALYGVGIRIDIDPAQARALGPLVLLRPWFLEVLGWAGFFLAGYRFWACYRPHRSIDRELQARRFSRSEQAWELITRQCIEHNVFPESRQLKLATVAGNQRQLEAMARMFLAIARCAKPVVARIHGHALGGGTGLAAAVEDVWGRRSSAVLSATS